MFMVADLDTPAQCPSQLIQSWLRGIQHPQFLLRLAVMEIESWIMADRQACADFLAIPVHRIPQETDTIPHPKEFLVTLARRSRKKSLREALVPASGATSVVGRAYNSCLWEFVHNHWNGSRASQASTSLRRTLDRLHVVMAARSDS